MRMKEPATNKGRLLKCPMCRVTEKEPGERSSFSYKYELAQLYGAAPPRAVPTPPIPPRQVPIPPRPVAAPLRTEDWAAVADRVRQLPINMRHRQIWLYPQLEPYFENYIRQPFAAQVAPQNRAAIRPEPTQIYHAFCQGGRRETGGCQTRSKTKRKCTHAGCHKFVCRSCCQCLTH